LDAAAEAEVLPTSPAHALIPGAVGGIVLLPGLQPQRIPHRLPHQTIVRPRTHVDDIHIFPYYLPSDRLAARGWCPLILHLDQPLGQQQAFALTNSSLKVLRLYDLSHPLTRLIMQWTFPFCSLQLEELLDLIQLLVPGSFEGVIRAQACLLVLHGCSRLLQLEVLPGTRQDLRTW